MCAVSPCFYGYWLLLQREEAKALELLQKSSNNTSSDTPASADESAAGGEVTEEDGRSPKAKHLSSHSSSSSNSTCCYKLVGHEGRILALTLAESDDRCLLTGGSDAIIRLWPTPYSRGVEQLPQQQQDAAVSDADGEKDECTRHGMQKQHHHQQHLLPLCQYRGAIAPIWSLSASPLGWAVSLLLLLHLLLLLLLLLTLSIFSSPFLRTREFEVLLLQYMLLLHIGVLFLSLLLLLQPLLCIWRRR